MGLSTQEMTRLSELLLEDKAFDAVVLVSAAIGGSGIERWAPGGDLNKRILLALEALRAAGLEPTHLLWQQGETDMRIGLEARHYQRDLRALRDEMLRAGIRAPMIVATSTFCRGTGTGAIARTLSRHRDENIVFGIVPGPDLDRLGADFRDQGICHFNRAGLRAAGQAWAKSVGPYLN